MTRTSHSRSHCLGVLTGDMIIPFWVISYCEIYSHIIVGLCKMVVNKKVEPGQTTCEGLIQGYARQRKIVHKPAFNGGLWRYKYGYSA